MQPDGFHVSINGPANSLIEIMASDDLVTWTSLASFSLSGNFYDYIDTAANSFPRRFYRARNQNGCSSDTVGFINVALPAGKYVALTDQLNNPAGSLVSTLFAGLPSGTVVEKWSLLNNSYTSSTMGGDGWSQPGMALNSGEGALVKTHFCANDYVCG